MFQNITGLGVTCGYLMVNLNNIKIQLRWDEEISNAGRILAKCRKYFQRSLPGLFRTAQADMNKKTKVR